MKTHQTTVSVHPLGSISTGEQRVNSSCDNLVSEMSLIQSFLVYHGLNTDNQSSCKYTAHCTAKYLTFI